MRNKKLIALLSIVVSLVLVIIVCGATFLVRDIQAYSYYVDSPAAFDKKVIAASGIEKNSSMFFLDETEVKKRVEDKCADVVIVERHEEGDEIITEENHYGAEVINVERKFPDKVSINYIVYRELFQYRSASGDYYRCFASGKVSRKVTAEDFATSDFITVRTKQTTADKPKSYFQKSKGFDRMAMKTFIDYMHTVNVKDKQMPQRIASIDLTRNDGMYQYMYIKTKDGCAIEIIAQEQYFLDKLDELLHYGWSLFVDPSPDSDINPSSGKITVFLKDENGSKKPSHEPFHSNYTDEDYERDYLGA
ncbi:MAG: hypothetical protein J1G38_05155 [Clostridiales bacterium]|nr:hypothetical protein [Clostridiales bacterium]